MDVVEFSVCQTLNAFFDPAPLQQCIHTWTKKVGKYYWKIHYHKGDDLIGTNFHMDISCHEEMRLAEIPWMKTKFFFFEEKFRELHPKIMFELNSSPRKKISPRLKPLFEELREALLED